MIGHRRPASFATALARAGLILCAGLVGHVVAQNPPPSEPLQLRITWGGGEASPWFGHIAIDDGTLSGLKLVGPAADAAGSIWLDAGQLRIRTLSQHKLDRIEVVAQPGANSKLLIDLASAEKSDTPRLEVPLADLPRHPYLMKLDEHGNTLEIQVIPQPGLQIATSRRPLIVTPGERFSFEVMPVLANLTPGTTLDIQTTLSPARRKEPLWSDNQRLAVPVDGHPKALLDVPLPRAEGVYTIHVVATRPPGFRERFFPTASAPLAERSIQVVVLEPNPPAPAASGRWESVLEIDPTNPRWVERLPSWTQVRRIPGLNHGALGSIRAGAVDLPLGRFIELPPTAPGGDPHWQAYSLPVPLEAVGLPHALEIDYPANSEQYFGISIVEPNASGVVAGINRDAGVYVEGLGRSEANQKQTQRLVFWPRTQAPLLVVTNLHPTTAARFGQIRVFKRSTNQLSAGLPVGPVSHDRLIAAYLARSTVAETFGATQAVEPATGAHGAATECVDDCQTSYESATRLADYLRYSGYNSAIVNILGDDGPPLANLPSGAEPSNASLPTDQQRCDVDHLELMLRVLDREQIALVPAIDFAAPLPQLETLRRKSDPQISGLEWVNADGRTWVESSGNRRGLAPYYNLLDLRVQEAMLKVVQDLVEKCGQHRAFAGLAIQLSSDGYAQLPPLDWGMDDATVGRFERDTGIQLGATGTDRFAARHALLTGQHADAWRSWRAAQVSAFYARLAALVRGNSDRRLVLTSENVFAHPQLAARIRPSLLAENVENLVAAALFDAGIDRQALDRMPGIVFCPTRYVEPMMPLPDRAADLELNDAFAHSRQPSTSPRSRAALLYHRPLQQRLASFEAARIPWRIAGEMQLVCQPLPQGTSVAQPYVEALVANDPAVLVDGGELLPIGQEESLREVRSTLAQLPVDAEVSVVSKQPILVRTYTEANRVTLLAVNMSPWHCDAQVALDVPHAAMLEPLPATTNEQSAPLKPLALEAGQQSWPLLLGPYEIRAARITGPGAKVVDVRADVGEAANSELAAKLADLTNRDLSAPHFYQALANPSFEPLGGAGPLPGWHLAPGQRTALVQLDATNPQDGKTCLYLRCDGQSAAVGSEPFPVPPTGQLAMTVFARGQNFGPATELRLAFEVDREGQIFRRVFSVPAAEVQRANSEWGRPFAILVNDLPLESRGQMRVVFELSGPGEVWLDNTKLYDLLFPLKFYANAQPEIFELYKQIHAAKSAFDSRQISDCVRILDGYRPRFILAYRPPVQPKIAGDAPKTDAASPPQSDEGQESYPGISKHIKRFVPILR